MLSVHSTFYQHHKTNPSSETPDAKRASVNKIAQSIFKGISTAFRFISGAVPALVLLPFRAVHIATSSLLNRIVNIRDNSLIKTAAEVLAIAAAFPLLAIAFLGIQQKESWNYAINRQSTFTLQLAPLEEDDDNSVPLSFPQRSETTPIIPTYQQGTYIAPTHKFNQKFEEFKKLPVEGNLTTMDTKYSLLVTLIKLLKENTDDEEGAVISFNRSIELDNYLKSDGMTVLIAMIKEIGSDSDTRAYVSTIPHNIPISPSFESLHRAFAPNNPPTGLEEI